MNSKQSLHSFYSRQSASVAALIRRLRRRGQAFVVAEVVLFLAAVGFVSLYALQGQQVLMLLLALASFAGYVVLRILDARTDRARREAEQLRQAYLRELSYLDGRFDVFPSGQEYADSSHPYSFDLDLFGPDSFFQRVNRTVTRQGSDTLAHWLDHVPSPAADILRRQKAVEQLAPQESLRARFMACRGDQLADTGQLLRLIGQLRTLPLSARATGRACLVGFLGVLVVFYATIVLSVMGRLHYSVPVGLGLFLFAAVQAASHMALGEVTRLIGRLSELFDVYSRLFRLAATMEHPADEGLLSTLSSHCGDMAEAMTLLRSQSSTLDSRGNALFLFFADTFALNGIIVLRRFRRWRGRYAASLERGIDAVSTLDALVSMATYRFNEPRTCWPEIVDDGQRVLFEGRDLRHPFLGEKAVGNDFHITDGHFYIVTGANMAGKSTFLRTVGLSYVMAANGWPVMARSLRVSLFGLFTSMRTSDDFAQGISYFNAELLRLQQLIRYCRSAQRPTLIILDEILKGTNSADKLNGSLMFLEYISRQPVTGIVATHDLELSKLEEQHPDRFHNYCFEISLGTTVTYSYKITAGVAHNQNASFLLRQMLGEEK
jgi:hypothetical protein